MAQQTGADTRDERIDAENDEDIRRWANELGVTHVAIIDAVRKVGPRVADVRRQLDQAMAGGQADA
jgi:copper homeostasis protein CutC